MAHALQMQGVFKAFDGVVALDDAKLEVKPGEVHGLIGQNGAGKSSLIKVLMGIYRRESGTILLNGEPVDFANPHIAQGHGISTIYQELNLIPLRTVAENISLGHEPRRWGMIDSGKMRRRARELLDRLGVDIDVDAPLGNFGSGIRQLIAIARALSLNAKLVVMDEATSSLDAREAETLFGVIADLKQANVAVIYITHFLDELHCVCDRVTVMRDGKWVLTATVDEVDKLELVAAMLNRDIAQLRASGWTGFAADADTAGEALLRAESISAPPRVSNVSLTVSAGEVLGIAGLLGSGRTETARALFGADRRASGEVRAGADAKAVKPHPRSSIAAGIGFVTEDRKVDGIIPQMSVRENITLALLPRLARHGKVDRILEAAIVDKFIRQLDIRLADMEQPISQLSGGNQQKALLAKWLATEPDVLILDEPTRGVDVGAKREILAVIREFAGAGKAVLMISSEFEELVEGADRIVIMHEGEIAGEMRNPGVTEQALIAAVVAPSGEDGQHARN